MLGKQHEFLAGLATTKAERDQHYEAGLEAYREATAKAPADQKKGIKAWKKDLVDNYLKAK
jgi:hypothetical protein